jgi:hypothetical protein
MSLSVAHHRQNPLDSTHRTCFMVFLSAILNIPIFIWQHFPYLSHKYCKWTLIQCVTATWHLYGGFCTALRIVFLSVVHYRQTRL